MSAALPQLPPEIWMKVIRILQRPLPPPTGDNVRSSIRQPELVVLMRVNTLFNNIASPLLYRDVVVDDLPSFVHNLHEPASAPGIKSKCELISLVRRTYLEYCDKSPPSYLDLMRSSRSFARLEVDLDAICAAEARWMTEAAQSIVEGGIDRLEKCLSVHTGIFLGGQHEIWKRRAKDVTGIKKIVSGAREAISDLASARGRTSFCQRVQAGPLAYAALTRTKAGVGLRQHRMHFESSMDFVPTIVGGKSRWYCPPNVGDNRDRPGAELWLTIANCVNHRELGRKLLEARDDDGDFVKDTGLSVDIYVPKAFIEREGRAFLEDMVDRTVKFTLADQYGIQGSAALDPKYKNDFKLMAIEDSLPCECGWSADLIKAGDSRKTSPRNPQQHTNRLSSENDLRNSCNFAWLGAYWPDAATEGSLSSESAMPRLLIPRPTTHDHLYVGVAWPSVSGDIRSQAQLANMPASAPPQLLPEIYARVMHHLLRPLPAPNGKSERSAIHQHDLTVMMRVNREFNNIASLILYRRVIVDHLPSFLYDLNAPPAARGIRAKSELIPLVRHLHLEYYDKSCPSYSALMRHGSALFSLIDIIPKQRLTPQLLPFCRAECDWIVDAARQLLAADGELLEGCQTISTGAFLGGQYPVWAPIARAHPSAHTLHAQMMKARGVITGLATLPRITSFCQRAVYGPLSFAPLISMDNDPEYEVEGEPWIEQHRAHIDGGNIGEIAGVPGAQSRWYCDFDTWGDDFEVEAAYKPIRDCISRHVIAREVSKREMAKKSVGWPAGMETLSSVSVDIYGTQAILQRGSAGAAQENFFSVDIYVPPALLQRGGQEAFAEAIDAEADTLLKRRFGMARSLEQRRRDQWTLKDWRNAPRCEACTFCVDDS